MTESPKKVPVPRAIPLVNPAIEAYLGNLLTHLDTPALIDMESFAQKNNFPIVGRLAGSFIEIMATMVQAQRVFEFGSGYGYSAYWFAKAVGPTGKVLCSEADFLNRDRAQQFLSTAELWERIDFKVGMAQALFAETEGFVFQFRNGMSARASWRWGLQARSG